jgi:hypothetical protein
MKHARLLILLLLATAAFAQEKTPLAISSLQGIGIGTNLEEARSKLAQLGTGGGRDTREGGRKEAWTLKETEFTSLAFKTNGAGRIVWVSAFARPGKEIPFARLGDLTKANVQTKSEVIWNVQAERGGYRLVAKGSEGKASVIYLLSLDFPEIR